MSDLTVSRDHEPRAFDSLPSWVNISKIVAAITSFALFVIACVGIAGSSSLSDPTFCWMMLGVTGTHLLAFLADGKLNERKFQVILNTVLCLGIMGLATAGGLGLLSASLVSKISLGIIFSSVLFHGIQCYRDPNAVLHSIFQ